MERAVRTLDLTHNKIGDAFCFILISFFIDVLRVIAEGLCIWPYLCSWCSWRNQQVNQYAASGEETLPLCVHYLHISSYLVL